MVFFYHVTGHKPSAVITSCTGHFTGPDDLNLIIAKNTFLEVHEVTAYGLKLLKEIPIFGRIVAIKLFSRKNKVTKSLFVVTEKAQAAVIECQQDQDNAYEFITLASGSFEERSALVIDKGFSVLVDMNENFIVLRFYKGILKIIPLASLQQAESNGDKSNQTLAAKTVRIEEFNVMDMTFLHSENPATLAILHEGSIGTEVKLMHLESDCALTQLSNDGRRDEVEPDASMLIPVGQPYGGFVVVSLQVITYYGPIVAGAKMHKISQCIPITQKSNILCYGTVDAKRYLLGDLTGRLYMLHLLTSNDQEALGLPPAEVPSTSKNSQQVCGMQLQLLGEITIPESISYLDNGVLFIGSRLGDSQLVRLVNSVENETENLLEKQPVLWNGSPDYVRVLESFSNIGPIVDMILMEWDRQGQSQLVTASGAFKNGSLRIIRNGIGIQEHASIDQEMIKAIWCFNINSDQFDDSILLSLVGQSKMLSLNQDDIEPNDMPGLETELQTYHAAVLQPGYFLQVTNFSLRLLKVGEGLVQEWRPPNQKSVSHCSSNRDQVIVASGPEIYYLKLLEGKLTDLNHYVLDNEVACLDLTPFNADSLASSDAAESKLLAVGLWIDFSIVLLTLPDLKVVHTQPLNTSIIPRSLLITQFECTPYLFVGLGDGVLLSFVIDTHSGTLRDEKRVHVGTGPMTLRRWISHVNKIHVFVCSDHPCIIYSANQKLVFANVNLKEVTFMSKLNSEYYRNCLAIVSPECMIFGSVDDVQKLHIRRIPLEESPKRLAWQEETGIIAVISHRTEQVLPDGQFKPTRDTAISLQQKVSKTKSQPPKTMPTGNTTHHSSLEVLDVHVSSLLIFDHTAFELQHVHTFSHTSAYSENAVSVASCKELMPHPILIVGTAMQTHDSLEEPKHGRLVVFKWTENGGPLEYLFDYEIKGSPYQIIEFNGKLLVTVNCYVYLYELKENSFIELTCYCDSIISLFMKKKGDFVLVGDIMRSLYLLRFSEITKKLDLIGKHMKPRWVSSIEFIDDDHFLSSESTNNNIFVLTKENEPTNYTNYNYPQLNEYAWFHTGEFINTFLHGSMVMQNNLEPTLPISQPLLYGSVFGAVGLVCQLSAGLYHLLTEVEKRLNQMIHTAGDFNQATWRSIITDKGVRPVKNFIDGDLIESFLDLSLTDKQKIVENLRIFNDLGSLTLTADNTRPCQIEDLVKIIEELSRLH